MSGKQKEGDNQRRRTLGRQAREQGQQPSQAGKTLSASKQFEHLSRGRRSGPPPAGTRKPGGAEVGPAPPPAPSQSRPRRDPGVAGRGVGQGSPVVRYRDLVDEVGRRAGINFDHARMAAEATITALARALDETNRQRLLNAVPAALRNDFPVVAPPHRRDMVGFLNEVARSIQKPRDQARYQAQATLSALAEQDRDLVDGLDLPHELRELLVPPLVGGGLVNATGHTSALTDEELRAALSRLPYWSGSQRMLARSLVLPPDNLERVLSRIDLLRQEIGRVPQIARHNADTAVITIRTSSADAVTAMDIELAAAVDAAIDEAGAGIA